MKLKKQNALKVAENNFQFDNQKDGNELSKGLSITHEQVDDTFSEGTIDKKVKKQKNG